MTETHATAPGHPGIEPRWTSSRKSGIGTAIGPRSRVWFTLSHGVLNEIYYPRVDQANTRDMEFLVTGDGGYFSEEKRDTTSDVALLRAGVPGYRVVNTSRDGRYRITKSIIADPERDVVLQEVCFETLEGQPLRLYALLAPHIGNQGAYNSGWRGDYKGMPILFASRGNVALALASSVGFLETSCGYVGVSDGWQQLSKTGRLDARYDRAPDGNIALTAGIDVEQCGGRFVLALALAPTTTEAAESARASLLGEFAAARDAFIAGWSRFHEAALDLISDRALANDEYLLSIAMLRVHEDKTHPGGMIASLSIPWGETKGDHDIGGYHVVWPRDLAESASALLAAGHDEGARDALHFLMVTQDADGHWPQNMWLDGTAWWSGTQLDETAFPILLADHLRRRDALATLRPWPMVRRAAGYLLRNGPVTPEDRWEEDGGYSPFTLAVEIAALLAAADFADDAGDKRAAKYIRETADAWNSSVERWTYVTGTRLAARHNVDGYYVRIAPKNAIGSSRDAGFVTIKNHSGAASRLRYDEMVSPDALALVRFGLRAATDKRIADTVRVIDAMLRVETANGPAWHRYNDDGYGEHADGTAFDGTGIGRGWPLLAGERGHFELARGNSSEARCLLAVMSKQSGKGGLIPEQIWDADDIPARELVNGCPSGSAMPLVWAHAEYVKLARSIEDGRPFDTPPQTVQRYIARHRRSRFTVWRFNNKARTMRPRTTLRIETAASATIRWSHDDWHTVIDTGGKDTTMGLWVADLDTKSLPEGTNVRFTMFWPDADKWEGRDYHVRVKTENSDASSNR